MTLTSKNKKPKYRIDQREGNAHGDLYELEQDFFFDVVDTTTEKIVMTFEGHYFGVIDGAMWKETNYIGVRKVELSTDDHFVLVYEGDDKEPKKIKL